MWQALDTLMKAAEDLRDDLVVIFAGYPADMDTLARRIKWGEAGTFDWISSRTEDKVATDAT